MSASGSGPGSPNPRRGEGGSKSAVTPGYSRKNWGEGVVARFSTLKPYSTLLHLRPTLDNLIQLKYPGSQT